MRLKLTVLLVVAMVLAFLAPKAALSQFQQNTTYTTCALTSSVTTCPVQLPSLSASCRTDTSGTWTGQLDFQVVGQQTPAPAMVAQPSSMSSATSTTTNGFFSLSVVNAVTFQVIVDTPGSFTGTANVSILCLAAQLTISTSRNATPIPWTGGSPEPVAIASPLDGSQNVKVNCITGCSASATIPPELSTTAPLPVATSLPAIAQNYWWNGSGWVADTASSPLPVTTPAPNATVFIANTPAVNQGTSPWVVTTPYNSPQPLPTASAGVAPVTTASYPQVVAINACYYPLGSMPSLTLGNIVTQQCSVAGFPEVSICGATSGNCAGVNGSNALQTACLGTSYPCGFPTPLPVPSPVLPTASPGVAAPTTAQQVQDVLTCVSDQATGTAITAHNLHVLECESHGIIAQGLCTSGLPCVPSIGDTSISQAVTTTVTQVIAAPAAGVSIYVTSLFALGEETATGGVMQLTEGTGTNCATIVKQIPILAIGATFTANQQVAWGGGGAAVLIVPAATALCVGITAGTVSTANLVLTYNTH